jgi:hypothetical protein
MKVKKDGLPSVAPTISIKRISLKNGKYANDFKETKA